MNEPWQVEADCTRQSKPRNIKEANRKQSQRANDAKRAKREQEAAAAANVAEDYDLQVCNALSFLFILVHQF